MNNQESITLKLHYFFSNTYSHSMNARVHNDCDKQFIHAIQLLNKYFDNPFEVIVFAKDEGGIKDHYQIIIKDALVHNGKDIKTYYLDLKKRDITKVRFDDKADVAFKLGLIDKPLMEEVIHFYNLRNGIHLHAELRKQIVWDLEMSKMAYWRIEKLNKLVEEKLIKDKKYSV